MNKRQRKKKQTKYDRKMLRFGDKLWQVVYNAAGWPDSMRPKEHRRKRIIKV